MPTPHFTASAETRPACVPRENTPYDNYVITSSPVPADRHSPNSRYVCDSGWLRPLIKILYENVVRLGDW